MLDIDPRNGGADTFAALNEGHELPPTLETTTGSGGLHLWYRLPYAGQLRGTAGPGIDIKKHNGYLVMPGSIHPDTGRLYRFTNWVCPHLLPPLPEHLRRHVYRPAPPPPPVRPEALENRAVDGLIRAVAAAGDGQRNSVLFWAAARAAERGLNLDHDLSSAAQSAGLDNTEIKATLASARRTDATRDFH